MLAYIIRRLGYAFILIILVSFVSFLIIELPPGYFLTQKIAELSARGDRGAEQRIDEYRARYGLDKPVLERYWIWISNFIKGDFGESFQFERPVAELIGERLVNTAFIALFTLGITWIVAIPIGVYSATHQYTLGDQVVTTVSFLGIGMPSFLLALIVLFFAVVVFDADIGGLYSREFRDAPMSFAKFVDLLKHIWLPALIGCVTGAAGLIRIMRGNLLETMGQPFVEAARARGLDNRVVTWKHAVRVAINPLVVIFATESLPGIVVGNILVARVLNLPTIGPLFISALTKQDMYMAGTVLVFLTLLVTLGSILGDILLAAIDPRIRLD